VLGLFAATVAVHLTGRHDAAVVAVMVACVVLGLYLFRVSYVFMAFAVTTVMGELYNVLHEFSSSLLVLRLEETALGSAIAVAVAVVVLPIRTADARAAAEQALLDDLADLLVDVRDRLRGEGPRSDLYLDSRHVDARLHQLALVTRPAAGAMLLGVNGRRSERDLSRWTAAAYRARALAEAVGRTGADPARAADVEALRAALVEGTPPPELPEGRDPAVRALADLQAALAPLLPRPAAGGSTGVPPAVPAVLD
jgi:uncharacterized membrane protein YccC